jgi:hypothetical protein
LNKTNQIVIGTAKESAASGQICKANGQITV